MQRSSRHGRRATAVGRVALRNWRVGCLVLACVALVWGAAGCGARGPSSAARPGAVVVGDQAGAPAIDPASTAAIRTFCGDCHALPDPASFPREDWPREVRQGYVFYERSLRSDLPRPPEAEAVRFFQAAAPEVLVIDRACDRVETPAPVRFEPLPLPATVNVVDPAVAHVRWEADERAFTTSDMRSGEVRRWRRRGDGGWESDLVARAAHACRLTPLTMPGAPATGWLLADLGSFHVVDHDRGRVLRIGRAGAAETLVDGVSRVVEAQPWPDGGIVVAEFGWRDTGALRLVPAGGGAGTILDPRHGALGVRVADLDADGQADIVAAFAQEHETVDAWWGSAGGEPVHETIHRFPDPSWGSSGFDLVDLDADGRIDILHVNGDMMDSGLAKPVHGVRWLRNAGGRRFECREIMRIPAAAQAAAADLDGDGDLDIVVSALHPRAVDSPPGTFAALMWLEQRSGGDFALHTIAFDTCDHAAFALGDVDGDARTDIIAGVWRSEERGPSEAPIRVYLNRPSPSAPGGGVVSDRGGGA